MNRFLAAGATGRLEGTRAWPGHATLWLTITPDDQARIPVAALRDYKAHLEPGEQLHASVMAVEEFSCRARPVRRPCPAQLRRLSHVR